MTIESTSGTGIRGAQAYSGSRLETTPPHAGAVKIPRMLVHLH